MPLLCIPRALANSPCVHFLTTGRPNCATWYICIRVIVHLCKCYKNSVRAHESLRTNAYQRCILSTNFFLFYFSFVFNFICVCIFFYFFYFGCNAVAYDSFVQLQDYFQVDKSHEVRMCNVFFFFILWCIFFLLCGVFFFFLFCANEGEWKDIVNVLFNMCVEEIFFWF